MEKSTGSTLNPTKKNQLTSDSDMKNSKENKSKSNKTLDDLFEDGLKDIYSAEKQLIEALPEMAKAADSEDLHDAFTKHLQQTKRHAERIEKVFERMEIDKTAEKKCDAMEGLIKENKKIIEEFDKGPVRDSALIIGAQKAEHYEIASYGSLCELADVLGYTKIAEILDRTLAEEEETDDHLTYLAQGINDEAYEMKSEEEMA